MTMTEFNNAIRNQFSGNRMRVRMESANAKFMSHMHFHRLQYIRKMTRLMNDGKLPAHVDPEAIVNAPPSKKLRSCQDDIDDLNQDVTGDTPTRPETADVLASGDAASAHNPDIDDDKQDRGRKRRPAKDNDSDSTDLSSLDNILSDSDSGEDSNLDVIRSSSPSCGAQQDPA